MRGMIGMADADASAGCPVFEEYRLKRGMLGIRIARDGAVTLSRQIRGQIADLVLSSHLHAGDVLPSTRELAKSVGVSRNTVNEAYEMLWAEGYIEGVRGSGFRVLEGISLAQSPRSEQPPPSIGASPAIRYDFRTGIPDPAHFPFAAWNRIQRDILETIKPGDMLYGNAQGYAPLREAVSDWLLRSRGMRTRAENILVTSGATQAISLTAETLCGNGRTLLVENPCSFGIARLMRLKGLSFAPVGVDAHGMEVENIGGEKPAGVYVTPSHQFPLGCVLSAQRRARLVAAAREGDFHIIEDDYDSEYRYGGGMLTPLHALDPQRVVYVGSFSKTLFPALRIGFAVVPDALLHDMIELRRYTDVQNAVLEQATLHRFLEQRRMDRHIRKMTRIYGRRRDLLVKSIAGAFGRRAEILGDGAGLHLALRLPGKRFGRDFRERCREKGLALMPCSRYVLDGTEHGDTLLLGYGNAEESRIAPGVRLLSELIP